MLRRAGFGVTNTQVDAVAKQNWPDYVEAALRADPEADRGAVSTPVPTLPSRAAFTVTNPASPISRTAT
jgi:hypothetical protein